jgi:SAM-dependent methyltransferase
MDGALSRNFAREELEWWHRRYSIQAGWTRALRYSIYRRIELARRRDILELGCGTGVIARELAERTGSSVLAMDSDFGALSYARRSFPAVAWLSGRAGRLPFRDGSLDLVATNYFWLWAGEADSVARECRRVLKPGGVLAALAEPDYSKRADHPDGRTSIRDFLSEDLRARGADPAAGGKLEGTFVRAGFETETGMVDDSISFRDAPELFRQEWELLEKLGYPPGELDSIKADPGARMAMTVCWATGRKR